MHPFKDNPANESEKRLQKLFGDLAGDQADLCALILSASGIAYTVARAGDRWEIWVKQADAGHAISKIKKYFRENPDTSQSRFVVPTHVVRTYTGIYAALGLMLLHWMIYYHNVKPTFVEAFGADTDLILKGEIFRAVTALMIHSDALHLMGNMAGIGIFGTAVCLITRPGLGWLLILLSGILGNLANAWLRGPGHLSIGASTAVFGAIGILSAIEFWRRVNQPGRRFKAWLPLAGGIALLGLLGTGGGRTDLMAHLFGLIAGLALGSCYGPFVRNPIPEKYQNLCWGITGCILMIAWFR